MNGIGFIRTFLAVVWMVFLMVAGTVPAGADASVVEATHDTRPSLEAEPVAPGSRRTATILITIMLLISVGASSGVMKFILANARRSTEERNAAFRAYAYAHGCEYHPLYIAGSASRGDLERELDAHPDRLEVHRFLSGDTTLALFRQGFDRLARNVIHGPIDNGTMTVFDYTFTETCGGEKRSHSQTVVSFHSSELAFRLPDAIPERLSALALKHRFSIQKCRNDLILFRDNHQIPPQQLVRFIDEAQRVYRAALAEPESRVG